MNRLDQELGTSEGYCSRLLKGDRNPGADILEGVVRALGVEARWLLLGEGPMFGQPSAVEDVYSERALACQAARLDGIRPDAIEIIASIRRSTAPGVPPLTWRQWLSRIEAAAMALDEGREPFGDVLPQPPQNKVDPQLDAVQRAKRL